MLRTDVYVTADLYQAKRQDKPRIAVPGGRGGGGENFHMKGAGLLDVLLRGVNFGFWSPFNGCSEQNVIILGLHAKIYI